MPVIQSGDFLEKIQIHKINNYVVKYINYIVSVIGLLIVANGCFYFIYPEYRMIRQAQEYERRKLEVERDYLKNYSDVLSEYNKEYDNISNNDKKIVNNIVLDGNNLEDLYRYFEKTGSDLNLVLTDLNMDFKGGAVAQEVTVPANEGTQALLSQLGVIGISFSVEGVNYNNLKHFIEKIENDSLLMDIQNITFSLGDRTASFQINCYYLKKNNP